MKKNNSTGIYIGAAVIILIISFSLVWWQSRARALSTQRSSLDLSIEKLDKEIASDSKSIYVYISAANAYTQKIRETADASYYKNIDDILSKAEKIEPHNADIFAERANLENGRHHFKKGLEYIVQSLRINPEPARYYGIKADSEIELGLYDDAEVSLQTMVDKKPNYISYVRISYLRQLTGDIDGSKQAFDLAIEAGSSLKENTAWAYAERGALEARDDLEKAKMYFNHALTLIPNYPKAYEGLGKIAYAQGDIQQALEYFTLALSEQALAQYAAHIGDVYAAQGDIAKAQQQYVLVEIAYKKSETSGVNIDQEYSLFLSDHGDPVRALVLAQQAYKDRPSIYGADVLAWAYYKNNNFSEALKYSKESLRLSEADPLLTFHAGMIAEAIGDDMSAREYFQKTKNLDSHFSIYYGKIIETKLE